MPARKRWDDDSDGGSSDEDSGNEILSVLASDSGNGDGAPSSPAPSDRLRHPPVWPGAGAVFWLETGGQGRGPSRSHGVSPMLLIILVTLPIMFGSSFIFAIFSCAGRPPSPSSRVAGGRGGVLAGNRRAGSWVVAEPRRLATSDLARKMDRTAGTAENP